MFAKPSAAPPIGLDEKQSIFTLLRSEQPLFPPLPPPFMADASGLDRSGHLDRNDHGPGSNIFIGNGRYRIIQRLGGGAFGEVYLVQQTTSTTAAPPLTSPKNAAKPSSDAPQGSGAAAATVSTSSTESYFAAKFEPVRSAHQPHLAHEARLYAHMSRNTVTVGIPRIKWYGTEGEFNILVMELVGPSLEDLFDHCKHRFKLSTVLMLADQMLSRLEFVHALGYVHRDLKPENFAMGMGKRSHHVYLLDFGLAKRFIDGKSGQHVPFCDGKALTGTARYVSVSTHLGIQQSRRDDIESLGFVLLYLARGSLPWQGVKCASKAEKYERIKSMKLSSSPSQLASKLPPCFAEYMLYARGLKFEESPNYAYCRELFNAHFRTLNCPLYDFTWRASASESPRGSRGSQGGASQENTNSVDSTRRGLSHVSEFSVMEGPNSARGGPSGSPGQSAYSTLRRTGRKKMTGFQYDEDELFQA